jgi:uncharacterized protein
MKKFSSFGFISLVLVIIGGLNWGLVGLMGLNLVDAIFGPGLISRVIYILVGIGAVLLLIEMFRKEKPAA